MEAEIAALEDSTNESGWGDRGEQRKARELSRNILNGAKESKQKLENKRDCLTKIGNSLKDILRYETRINKLLSLPDSLTKQSA